MHVLIINMKLSITLFNFRSQLLKRLPALHRLLGFIFQLPHSRKKISPPKSPDLKQMFQILVPCTFSCFPQNPPSLPSKMKPLRCVITSHKNTKNVHIFCKTMNDPMNSHVQIWLIWEARRERRGLSWVGVLHIQDTCILSRLTATCVFLIFSPALPIMCELLSSAIRKPFQKYTYGCNPTRLILS